MAKTNTNKTNKTNTNNTNANKIKTDTTQTYIKQFENASIIPFKVFNSNKMLKSALNIVFAKFEIVSSNTNELDFNLLVKIKSNDFETLQTNELFDINDNLKMKLNIFDNVYKQDFIDLLKNIDTTTKKMLLSKTICYCLKLSNGLFNTIKFYKENNLKPTVNDILTKQKLSIYQVLKQFVFVVYGYVNTTNK